jgi:hypothetical protein
VIRDGRWRVQVSASMLRGERDHGSGRLALDWLARGKPYS